MVLASLGPLTAVLVAVAPRPAAADVNSDKAQIAQLGTEITQEGNAVQNLVARYNQAQTHVATIDAQLQASQVRLAGDRKSQAKAVSVLRVLALDSYMNGAGDTSALALFETGSITSMAAEQQYAQIASGRLHSAIDTVQLDEARTETDQAQLRTQQGQAEASVAQLSGSRQAAQAALTRDDTLLSQAQGNLQSLLAAQAAQRAAAEEREEEAMAARQAAEEAAAQAAEAAAAASQSGQSVQPTSVAITVNPSPGSYADPLRSIDALTPERVDQGVDYSGFGTIYAVGDGVIQSTGNSGWPGGTFICYRLSDGPAGGLAVYAAEDIYPTVKVGQSVTAGTAIGTMYEGPDGIETGWADPSCDGVSMANDAHQFSGANSTAFGANFSQLLSSLGAPAGIMQNDPATGVLPDGWPSW
ncbi:MAG TPA: hypothetical protein VMB72_11455 [Acidimicrobiales bacterium]|nr:hypothetical protein [Acidimicrobiales bacterium]